MASDAAGYSEPLLRTADRNAPPWPGGGAMSDTASSTATSVGTAHSSRIDSHTRGRMTSLRSSTVIMAITPVAGQLEHDILQGAAFLADRRDPDAVPDQCRV